LQRVVRVHGLATGLVNYCEQSRDLREGEIEQCGRV
jgi:hypothetical protein